MGFVLFLPGRVFILLGLSFLRGRQHRRVLAVVQGFVHFSAYPEVMQQHRQLSGSRNDGSLLSVSSSSFRQLQSPAPEIAVRAKRTQDVLCSLHQQRSQVRIAFLADVQLRLALTRVSSSRLQPLAAAHLAALAGQDVVPIRFAQSFNGVGCLGS